MSTMPPSFEDPSLKSAIRGVAGGHRAAVALRDKVAQRMAAEIVAAPNLGGGRQLVGAKRWLAMAATIAVAVTAVLAAYTWYDGSSFAREHRDNTEVAQTVWSAMGAMQDGHCLNEEALATASRTDAKAIAAEASAKFKRRIPTPDFSAGGWKLTSASYCTLAGYPGVCFHFAKGDRAASVVSLPEAAWAYRSSDSYTTAADGHQIAGYVKDGGLHCVVGDRAMSLADVQAMVDQLRTQ